MQYSLKEIIKHFSTESSIEPYGDGHINDTYLAETNPKFILQRLNNNVFKQPEMVMRNIGLVTEHIRKKISAAGGNPDREGLTLVKTLEGEDFYKADDNNYFRVYKFIEDATSYNAVENPLQFYNAAKSFGKFQNMLSDFPADKLFETIPDFHNTRIRFNNLKKAIEEDKCGRVKETEAEIEFALARESDVDTIVNGISDGSIPLRVTHNDTKLNNVMLDNNTGEGVCVIDLDTVMPGSLLYDYGDALRFGASTGSEDEVDLSKIWFDIELFTFFTRGFLEELGSVITKRELELLPYGAKIMTYECGIRFLTDYLSGDTYFKIHHEKHNLHRARTQLKLVSDIEEKMKTMNIIINDEISSLRI